MTIGKRAQRQNNQCFNAPQRIYNQSKLIQM